FWVNATTATDRFQYGYDPNGNRLYRSNLVNHSFDELYHANGAANGYDALNQLVAFSRGVLNSTKDSVPQTQPDRTWAFDTVGNWASVTTNGTAVSRTYN